VSTVFDPYGERITTYSDPPPRIKDRVRAKGSVSYEDFAELLVELGKKVMPDVLITEEDPKPDVKTPVVTFEVIHETPIRTEVKPRPRDTFPESVCANQNANLVCAQSLCDNYPNWADTCGRRIYPYDASYYRPEGKAYMVWGQVMTATVQFNCWGSTGPEAVRLSTRFRDFVFTYTGVLKQLGVREIIFLERLRDRTITKWRDNLFSRSLRYKMDFEYLYVQEYDVISKIVVELSPAMMPYSERMAFCDLTVAVV